MMGSKSILITGASGFLGIHLSKMFSQDGCRVFGIGRGTLSAEQVHLTGMHQWHCGEITFSNLRSFATQFDVIIHCAGGSSVARVEDDPAKGFFDTVATTMPVLEFMRQHNPAAKLVYPSSAAVYGEHDPTPIFVSDNIQPVSAYGLHKQLAEIMCLSYRHRYNLNIIIIRFFSIYGPELRKQLLWDACRRVANSRGSLEFWGTGNETRDWIHIEDAVRLVRACIECDVSPELLNGGCGRAFTIKDTLTTLAAAFGRSPRDIVFNAKTKAGDPHHYCADIGDLANLGWQPKIGLKEGLFQYAKWFRSLSHD